MNGNTFRKSERLCGEKRISALFASGRSGFVYPFRYVFSVADSPDPGVSVLISVSKKYHKRAVKRNLLKRRTREAFRTRKHALLERTAARGIHIDLALILITKDEVAFKTIDDAVARILAQIP